MKQHRRAKRRMAGRMLTKEYHALAAEVTMLESMFAEIKSLSPAQIEARLDQYAGKSIGEKLHSPFGNEPEPTSYRDKLIGAHS